MEQAATELLEDHDLPDICMHRIAERAEVQPGSAYRFCDNAGEVFAAVATQFAERILDTVISPNAEECLHDRATLFRAAADRGGRALRQVYSLLPVDPRWGHHADHQACRHCQ